MVLGGASVVVVEVAGRVVGGVVDVVVEVGAAVGAGVVDSTVVGAVESATSLSPPLQDARMAPATTLVISVDRFMSTGLRRSEQGWGADTG